MANADYSLDRVVHGDRSNILIDVGSLGRRWAQAHVIQISLEQPGDPQFGPAVAWVGTKDQVSGTLLTTRSGFVRKKIAILVQSHAMRHDDLILYVDATEDR